MNDPIIVTTPAQLREIVADEVAAILPKLADFRRKNEPVETDGMNVEDAARFLTAQGIPYHSGITLQPRLQKHNPAQEIRTPYGVFEKRTSCVDRIAHRASGGQADRRRIAYRRECQP